MIFGLLTLKKQITMSENSLEPLSSESVIMLFFSFLAAVILMFCLISVLCYNCVFTPNQEDGQYNPTPISDMEKEMPHLLLKQNQVSVRWIAKTSLEKTIPMEMRWQEKEILL